MAIAEKLSTINIIRKGVCFHENFSQGLILIIVDILAMDHTNVLLITFVVEIWERRQNNVYQSRQRKPNNL